MTAQLEQQVRESLRQRADSGVTAETDPWAAFSTRERRHRRQRAARRTVVGVAGAGLVAALALGVVPLPAALPAIPVDPAAGSSLLQDAPTRGSLAGNTAWLAGLRQAVSGHDDGDGEWRVVDRKGIRIVFAGDVPGGRVALATVRYRHGVLEDTQMIWLDGPVGARPDQMSEKSNQDPVDVAATMSGSAEAPGYLVVVAPPGSTVTTSISPGATYAADGTIDRHWRSAGGRDGVAIVTVPASQRAPVAVAKVVRHGRTLFDRQVDLSWGSDNSVDPLPVKAAVVRWALDGARGPGIDQALAATFVTNALDDARLDRRRTPFSIEWTGRVAGMPAALIELRPENGGRLFYAVHGTAATSWTDLRLLVPAAGAQTRPLPWRIWGDDEKTPLGLGVYVPAGAARADLVVDGTARPLTLDSSGFALLDAPAAGSRVVVRSYRAGDELIGETTLPVPPVDTGGLPGDDPATRLPR
jgi:hypothetical protein